MVVQIKSAARVAKRRPRKEPPRQVDQPERSPPSSSSSESSTSLASFGGCMEQQDRASNLVQKHSKLVHKRKRLIISNTLACNQPSTTKVLMACFQSSFGVLIGLLEFGVIPSLVLPDFGPRTSSNPVGIPACASETKPIC